LLETQFRRGPPPNSNPRRRKREKPIPQRVKKIPPLKKGENITPSKNIIVALLKKGVAKENWKLGFLKLEKGIPVKANSREIPRKERWNLGELESTGNLVKLGETPPRDLERRFK